MGLSGPFIYNNHRPSAAEKLQVSSCGLVSADDVVKIPDPTIFYCQYWYCRVYRCASNRHHHHHHHHNHHHHHHHHHHFIALVCSNTFFSFWSVICEVPENQLYNTSNLSDVFWHPETCVFQKLAFFFGATPGLRYKTWSCTSHEAHRVCCSVSRMGSLRLFCG